MPSTTRPLFEQIDTWLQEVDNVKTAAAKKTVKKAAPSGVGKSSHPSDSVDDGTQNADHGPRYAENSADVKKDVPGQSVDETDPKSGGDQDDKQFNIGTNQSAVGEDPSVEDDYKGTKDDPGTSHPADAESVGEKYSSMRLDKLIKLAEEKANQILADFATGVGTGNGAPVQNNQKVAQAAASKPTPPPVQPAPVASVDAEKVASAYVAQAIRDADLDADLLGSYLTTYFQTRQKLAEEGGEENHEETPPPEEGGAGGASDVMPPDAGGAGPVMPPPGAGGSGDPLAALGGLPDAPPGADAGAGAGAPPGAGGDAGAGGGMSQEQALQELAMALQELGISPEELAQMAQSQSQGQGAKLASAVKGFKRAGRFRMEEAKTASQRQAREQIKDYIREITGSK